MAKYTLLYILLSLVSAIQATCHSLAANQEPTSDPKCTHAAGGSERNSHYTGYRSVAYYVNWATYARDHQPQDIPAAKLTHVLYAFANIHPETGEVYLSDKYADIEKHFPADSWNNGTNLYGCLKQLYLLKKHNRNLKLLLSIGGWTFSSRFAVPASTPDSRTRFAESAVALMKDLPFDGLDIDWEHPKTQDEGADFVHLLSAIRHELDVYGASLSPKQHFLLTVASPAGPSHYEKLHIRSMDTFLDFWNLMGYDFAGSWDKMAGHQSNVFPSVETPESTPFNIDHTVKHYIESGVPASKIVMGMPLYGRAFLETAGPGTPFTGVGEGSFEKGVWDYNVLPKSDARVYYDPEAIASWSYDNKTKLMVSYDNPQVSRQKAKYIKQVGLGGAMWWETSGDRPMASDDSLVDIVAQSLGGPRADHLEKSENCLDYPHSQYENLRNGMPDE